MVELVVLSYVFKEGGFGFAAAILDGIWTIHATHTRRRRREGELGEL
jgi:hypothetical protein